MSAASEEPACINYSKDKLVLVEGFVFATIAILGVLYFLGGLRQRVRSGILSFLLLILYTVASQAIPYTMGLMKNAPFGHELFPLWATMLLFAYGSADSMSARTLQENENTSNFMWAFIAQFGLSIPLFFSMTGRLLWPLLCLLLLMFNKVAERAMVLSFACKKPGVESVTLRLSEYMKTVHDFDHEPADTAVSTMRGCKYLVDVTDVEVEDHKIEGITVQQIWECHGRLMDTTHDPDDLLKDTCLSLALFWLLLRKFAGYPLHESDHPKTWSFVRNGLLSEDVPERAFRVIEVELNFLYDYFYTKYYGYFYSRYMMKYPTIVLVLSFGALALYSLGKYSPTATSQNKNNVRVLYQNYDIDILITRVLVVVIVTLEIVQVFVLVTSRWFKVKMLCYYVKNQVWRRENKTDRCVEKVIETICRMPCSTAMSTRSWQRKLNQYSLLDQYKRVLFNFPARMLSTYFHIPIVKSSMKEHEGVELTSVLKKAVVSTLKENGKRLGNGKLSLKRNGVEDLLRDYKFEMKAVVILVWHVATTLCEIHAEIYESKRKKEQDEEHNVHVATALSGYCAYLVAKEPRLLPDHSYKCSYTYLTVILAAKRILKDCDSRQRVYHKLMDEEIGEEEDEEKVLSRGASLGKYLINEIEDSAQRWKILAEFWAELILFLAPSDDAVAHAECLANGGEFITHLWALLIHAGILKRDDEDEAEAPVTTGHGVPNLGAVTSTQLSAG